MKKKMADVVPFLIAFLFSYCASGQETQRCPSFEEVISLRSAGSPAISPDGRHVAFTVNTADWQANRFDTEIWLAKDGAEPFPLTRTAEGSSTGPRWSPDGEWIAFLAKRGKNTQIFAIRIAGGEAQPLTNLEEDVQDFAWAPDGRRIAFTVPEKESKVEKNRSERYGGFAVEDEEYRRNWLYVIDFRPDLRSPEELPCYDKKDSGAQAWPCLQWPEPKALIDSVEYTVGTFKWSPDGRSIAFTHTPDPMINSFFDADISILDVDAKTVRPLVQNPSSDVLADWSPDGQFILYDSDESDRTSNYYKNSKLFRIPAQGGSPIRLARDFDENLNGLTWTERGIYATAFQKTKRHFYRIDPRSGTVQSAGQTPRFIFSFDMTRSGDRVAFAAENGDDLGEIYLSGTDHFSPRALTRFTGQLHGWKVAQSEVISWESRDGATIEGVLHKPADYDPGKKYPLLVVIHGGPTGIDRPMPVPAYVYPILQWLDKGALVLRPNYRGSAGYGEAFRSLNVRNLGVGDAWDVLSGVDYLAQQGLIDTTRMGAMGWSQGGYISAFLTTTSRRFKAISVGAGISNWMTYYVNTDIHPFTRQYLQATPWQDEDIYRKTSPMTYINQASTPTLIQHGEFDRRVPIPNAYELLQGLQDVGVDARLIVYKGFGHGITKPKERLAATWHNWQWFNKYLWGESVELPVEGRE